MDKNKENYKKMINIDNIQITTVLEENTWNGRKIQYVIE